MAGHGQCGFRARHRHPQRAHRGSRRPADRLVLGIPLRTLVKSHGRFLRRHPVGALATLIGIAAAVMAVATVHLVSQSLRSALDALPGGSFAHTHVVTAPRVDGARLLPPAATLAPRGVPNRCRHGSRDRRFHGPRRSTDTHRRLRPRWPGSRPRPRCSNRLAGQPPASSPATRWSLRPRPQRRSEALRSPWTSWKPPPGPPSATAPPSCWPTCRRRSGCLIEKAKSTRCGYAWAVFGPVSSTRSTPSCPASRPRCRATTTP